MHEPLKQLDYERLSQLLEQWTGIKLHGKEHLMAGRLAPRLRELGLSRFADYREKLQAEGRGGREAQRFINALTTNKTSFFREPHHFRFLVDHLFKRVAADAAKGGERRLSLYSAACSRGAEPYTMALLAAKHLPAAQGWKVSILATDVDTDVLADARAAVYTDEELGDVPDELRRRWFLRERELFRVHPEVARLVTFSQANLIARPFPVRGRFDAIFCRNVMIYFKKQVQESLVDELTRLLAPGGVLAVGHAESLTGSHLERAGSVSGVYRATSKSARAQSLRPKPAVEQATTSKLEVEPIVLGQWATSARPRLITTLLGSCVAVCLYDPVAKVGGMNHFMLPRRAANAESCTRFGQHAMEALVTDLLRLGAERARLQAKAFGAATINRRMAAEVAAQNERFIRHYLTREKIPLAAERLGGESAREIYLRTDTGEVFVRLVETSARPRRPHSC